MSKLIIGDVAGQFDALQELVEGHDDIILVGDLVDRGPKSKEVVEWAMQTKRVNAVYGNHEDMLIDFYEDTYNYDPTIWLNNGGYATLVSYGLEVTESYLRDTGILRRCTRELIPKEQIEFLKSLPNRIEFEDVIITHAPKPEDNPSRRDWIWNREDPIPGDTWQIFGHNSHWGVVFDEEGMWACIDGSASEKLTGLVWDGSMEIKQVDY